MDASPNDYSTWSRESPLRSMALILTDRRIISSWCLNVISHTLLPLSSMTLQCRYTETPTKLMLPCRHERWLNRGYLRDSEELLWLARPLGVLVSASTAFVLLGSCSSCFPPLLMLRMFIRSYIAGTNGYSNGIVPMLRAYDATARYVDQGHFSIKDFRVSA